MSITSPAVGLHCDVPFEDYKAWPAVNFSTLKHIRQTASKCRWEMLHPKKQTPAMVLGSALHIAVLEPGRFDGMFHICPPCDRRTTEGKAIYDEAEREANGRLLLRSGLKEDESAIAEVERIQGMAEALREYRASRWFIEQPGRSEVSLLWRDDETGLMCKARLDRMMGDAWVVEVKSTRDARDRPFSNDVQDKGYACQAAFYQKGLERATGQRANHAMLVVENQPPFDCRVILLSDAALQTGLSDVRGWLARYAECERTGKWPGFPEQVTVLDLPKWAE